ncbi:MAG: CPBP family intramembrane metalloprotease, partial [Steroidobacteraceae bacterium]|nr:CPBP family intramembrane metalloprotease [Steroidobacteraceae bacterium]MDW8258055.1 CPBP family intramembrane glutamic endopeptidase [Gammaproteobacteria bacterium]
TGLAAIAVGAYPVWVLLSPHVDVPFHRVASRVAMLAGLIAFLWLIRHLNVNDRASLGYGQPRREWLAEAGRALLLGVVTMLPVALAMLALGLRDWRPGLPLDAVTLLKLAADGLGTGIAVALIEETFLRGAMHSAVRRDSGPRVAIVLTAALYAALHFVARHRIPAEQVGPGSGLELLGGMLRLFAAPGAIADAFLSLFAVGVLLGIVRELTGSIAACVGLHAGWVWVISVVRESSDADRSHPAAFLLSRFDGVVGWLVLGWTLVLGVGLFRFYQRRQQAQRRDGVVGLQ